MTVTTLVLALLVGQSSPAAPAGPIRPRVDVPLPPPPAGATRAAAAPAAKKGPDAPGVEIAMRRMADALAGGFQKLPGSARYHRLAVLQFEEVGAGSKKNQLGTVVAAELVTNLRRDHGLLVVERARLTQILGDLRLSQMLGAEAKLPEIGRMAEAQALVVGSVSEAGDRFLVNARIVSVESAETLTAASEAVPQGSLVALSSDAVVLRTRRDAVFRSLLVPGWGQSYNRQPVKGLVFGGLAVATIGGAVAYHLMGAQAEADYRSKNTASALGSSPSAEAIALRDRAESRYAWRNGFLYATAGLWLVNVLDAYWFGVDGDRVVLAPTVPTSGGGGLGLALAARF
jgi:TolB-like protein